MPTYCYKCKTPGCEEEFDRYLPLARYDEEQGCPGCLQPAEKVLTPVRVIGDYAPYNCPITGQRIDGRKAHLENLKRHGCRIIEPGEKEDVDRKKARTEKELDKNVERSVEQFIDALPVEKKNRLMAEAEAGVTLKAERK